MLKAAILAQSEVEASMVKQAIGRNQPLEPQKVMTFATQVD